MGRYGRGCGSLLRPGGRRGLLGGAGVLPRRTSVLGARISQPLLARKGETGSKRRGHWTKVILRSRRFPNPTQGSLPRCTLPGSPSPHLAPLPGPALLSPSQHSQSRLAAGSGDLCRQPVAPPSATLHWPARHPLRSVLASSICLRLAFPGSRSASAFPGKTRRGPLPLADSCIGLVPERTNKQ